MRRRPLLVTLAAGAALTVAGCGGSRSTPDETPTTKPLPPSNPPAPEAPEPTANPPAPETPEPATVANPPPPGAPHPVMTANPPPPAGPVVQARMAERSPDRPSWDEVPSGWPKGRTNPPSPVLVVTPDGRCFKSWEGGMMPAGPDRVEAEPPTDATAIDCPPDRAWSVWKAWKTSEDGGAAPARKDKDGDGDGDGDEAL